MYQDRILSNGSVTSPRGFEAAAVAAGVKYRDRLDLALVFSRRDCAAAGMFTRNKVVAAPVIVDRETLQQNRHGIRAIVANSGNANACTGEDGVRDARDTQQVAADHLGCEPGQVLVLSTGVIGVHLPMAKLRAGVKESAMQLSTAGGPAAARAIMTTDTRPKQMAVQVVLSTGTVTIGGMAKGAGMIHPDMATMLSVLTTDVAADPNELDAILRPAVEASFNRISVDGDTSTNDTVLLLANGASGVTLVDDQDAATFSTALTFICTELAKMIVRDGEGVTKFVEIRVTGCRTEAEAHAVARTIATSPLVKTAFAGSDPNWGRILAAAGRSGADLDQSRLSLWIGDGRLEKLQLVSGGSPTAYREADAAAIFANAEIVVGVDLGAGDGVATMWTSDLTQEYVRINADYRT